MPVISNSTTQCSKAKGTSRPRTGLLVFADDWGRHPSSCQHLITHLIDKREIHWFNTIGTRRPRLNLSTLTRGLEKLRQWTQPVGRPDHLPARLQIHNPKMWPLFRSSFDRRLNCRLLLNQLAPLVGRLPAPPVAVSTIPIVADLIGKLPVDRWVYYCVDDFSEWPGLDGVALRTLEERMVERADLLIAVSKPLQEKLARMGRKALLLTHGVDLDHWSDDRNTEPIFPTDGLEPPLIVFWGLVDRRMDVAFLERLANDLTKGTILLVGPDSEPDPAIGQLPRLVHLGPVPFDQLPDLARRASVLIMPYADLPVTRAMQPLKLKEYLATGRPVVASNLPSTRPWSNSLDLAETPEQFSEAVRSRLDGGVPEDQKAARACLLKEGWNNKAHRFEHWIFNGEAVPHVSGNSERPGSEICP